MSLKQTYQDTIADQLKKEFKYTNVFQIPKLKKIVVNMGVSDPQDPRARKQAIENIMEQFAVITGQKPKNDYSSQSYLKL